MQIYIIFKKIDNLIANRINNKLSDEHGKISKEKN